jgi:hypothetical protein
VSSHRRYEILVPLKFNDGTRVPQRLIDQTLEELRQRFGTVSAETQTVEGVSRYGSMTFQDNLTRFFIDVPDEAQHLQFFKAFKETLKARFQQIDIWITSHPLEVI